MANPGHTYTVSEDEAGTDLKVRRSVLSSSRGQRRWDQAKTEGFVALATSEIQARDPQEQSLGTEVCVWKSPPHIPVSPSSRDPYSNNQ